MNTTIKQIYREINQGANLEVNLPKFFNRFSGVYYEYAQVKLTLLYYTFYEGFQESNWGEIGDTEKELLGELNGIIRDSYFAGFSGRQMEVNIKRADALRKQIIRQMKVLTAYTDLFQIYEYILNRVEYRFLQEKSREDNESEDGEFAAKVMNYIFEIKDNVVINSRLKEVLGQLPVRMTKARYFDLIRNSLSMYKGAEEASLDTYVYMLKSSATLYSPEGMDSAYPGLVCLKKNLEELDYKNITEAEYRDAFAKIEEAGKRIKEIVDFYYTLQEIVNSVYASNLLLPYAEMDNESFSDNKLYLSIIKEMNDGFLAGKEEAEKEEIGKEEAEEIDKEALEKKLEGTEGKQEDLLAEIEVLEACFDLVKNSYKNLAESLMLGPSFQCLKLAQDLLGNSLFVELNQNTADKRMTEGDIQRIQEELLLELSNLFQQRSREVYRAVVACTLNKIPVFLKTANEIMDYVKNSLEQCGDLPEKNASIDIIKDFWRI